jgi:predicted nuclease with TOPRIM domain
LLKQKGEYEEMLKNIENEKSVILETDEKFKEVEDRFNDVSGKLNDLKEELFIYEK